MKRRRWHEALLVLAALFFLGYAWMPAVSGVPNERTRIYLAVAMVDHHTLAIDAPIKQYGPLYDRASYQGRTYSDKAPGSSFLVALPYAAMRLFSSPTWSIRYLIYIMRWILMIPLSLLGFVVMRRVLVLTTGQEDIASLGAVAWLLASTAFHYSTVLYGHQIVAVALLVALWQVLRLEHGDKGLWRSLLAGFCAGVAGLTEYQAALPCLMLAGYALTSPARSWRHALSFTLGVLPGLVALLAYNHFAFGGPLELSYHHLDIKDMVQLHGAGIGGVQWPDPSRLPAILFSLHRGWLTTSPMFALLPLGVWALWRQGRRRLGLMLGTTALLFLLFLMGTQAWVGGWSFGLRLVVPVMAWLMIAVMAPLASRPDSLLLQTLTRATIAAGFAYHLCMRLTAPTLSPSIENPLLDVAAPALLAGIHGTNLVSQITQTTNQPWTLLPLALATCAMLLWICWPTLPEQTPRTWRLARKSALTSAALGGVLVLACVIALRGTTIDPKRSAETARWIEQWSAWEVGQYAPRPHPILPWPDALKVKRP